MKKTIWVNTLVCNEENFLWFALMSVAPYVDKILLWDSGSTDKTPEVIKALQKALGEKIIYKEVGKLDPKGVTKTRQEMLNETKSDWFLVLDGDEVWPDESIKQLVSEIQKKGDQLDSIAVPFYVPLGDIYHYQSDDAGRYLIDGRKGHLQIRAINRKIPGLHLENPYPNEAFFDINNVSVQEMTKDRRLFLETPYMHLTHLKRNSKYNPKFKYELGKSFTKNFKFPKVFYADKPIFIKSPFERRGKKFYVKSLILEIPRRVKRKVYG